MRTADARQSKQSNEKRKGQKSSSADQGEKAWEPKRLLVAQPPVQTPVVAAAKPDAQKVRAPKVAAQEAKVLKARPSKAAATVRRRTEPTPKALKRPAKKAATEQAPAKRVGRKVRKVRAAAAASRGTGRKPKPKGGRRKLVKPPPEPAPRHVKVRELDPFAMCGPGTSVERLFRVDERVNGTATSHLVFLDRHGWYCEQHGRNCPAVNDVRKLGKHTGLNYNGRMRA